MSSSESLSDDFVDHRRVREQPRPPAHLLTTPRRRRRTDAHPIGRPERPERGRPSASPPRTAGVAARPGLLQSNNPRPGAGGAAFRQVRMPAAQLRTSPFAPRSWPMHEARLVGSRLAPQACARLASCGAFIGAIVVFLLWFSGAFRSALPLAGDRCVNSYGAWQNAARALLLNSDSAPRALRDVGVWYLSERREGAELLLPPEVPYDPTRRYGADFSGAAEPQVPDLRFGADFMRDGAAWECCDYRGVAAPGGALSRAALFAKHWAERGTEGYVQLPITDEHGRERVLLSPARGAGLPAIDERNAKLRLVSSACPETEIAVLGGNSSVTVQDFGRRSSDFWRVPIDALSAAVSINDVVVLQMGVFYCEPEESDEARAVDALRASVELSAAREKFAMKLARPARSVRQTEAAIAEAHGQWTAGRASGGELVLNACCVAGWPSVESLLDDLKDPGR